MSIKNQKGANLIEIVVMMGVLMTVLSAVVVVTINGLKNSQFAKNQLLATKLAQEGIDKVKLAKNKNCQISFNSTQYYWYGAPNIWDNADILVSTSYSVDLTASPVCMQPNISDPVGPNFDSKFVRKIYLENDGVLANKRKKLTSEVSWNDLSGQHSSKLVTILSNN